MIKEDIYKFNGATIQGLAKALAEHGTIDAPTSTESSWNHSIVARIKKEMPSLRHRNISFFKTTGMKGTSITRFTLSDLNNQDSATILLNTDDPFEGR